MRENVEMETLKMHSLDGVQRNIDLIGKLFPLSLIHISEPTRPY